LVKRGDLSAYDKARLPAYMDGNVFLAGAKPAQCEDHPLVDTDFDPQIALVEKSGGCYLEGNFEHAWAAARARKLVTTELLGLAAVPGLPYENRDGSPLRIDADYFGKKRNEANPFPGPFESLQNGKQTLRIWPRAGDS